MDEKDNVKVDPSKLSAKISAKYTLTNNALKTVAKDNPKDRVEAVIGDDKQPDTFYPQVKIQRWDNEVNTSVRLKDDGLEKESVTTDKEKIVWSKGTKEVHFYDLPVDENNPEGGYEFEVILKGKPASNVIEFTLETKGLNFFYQPALTQKEIDEGVVRPENVVGSYAVYHKTKGRMNDIAGMEYKVGKAFHIYRPKVIDANGDSIWGELHIDEETGILTVTIDQAWLNSAVYPVIVDPTFGYTTLGSTVAYSYNDILGSLATGAAGTVSKLSVGTKNDGFMADTQNVKGVLVLHSSHEIVSNGVGIAVDVPVTSTAAWYDSTFSTAPTISAVSYDLTSIAQGGGAAGPEYLYDTGSASDGFFDSSNSYTSPTNPTDGVHNHATFGDKLFSIYATYTASVSSAVKDLLGGIIPFPR